MEMEFKVYVREVKSLLLKHKNQRIEQAIRFQDDFRRVTLPIAHLSPTEVKSLLEILDEALKKHSSDKTTPHNKWTRGRVQTYLDLMSSDVSDTKVAKTVAELAIVLKRFLEVNAPDRWIFPMNEAIPQPYFVNSIEHFKRKRDRDGDIIPARTVLHAIGYRNGNKRTVSTTWVETNYHPMTVSQALHSSDLVHETPVAVEKYLESLSEYEKLQHVCGLQMHAIGEANVAGGNSWSRSWGSIAMVRDGAPTRVVVDNLTEELKDNRGHDETRVFSTQFWEDIPDRNGLNAMAPDAADEEDDEVEAPRPSNEIMLPLHPFLYVFDLEKHQWVNIHVNNLQPYPWDKELIGKLILPKDQRDLLEVLMSTSGQNVGDIVRGKMSGVVVIATGLPGVGKTLTAEVFSEHIQKPLYNVQCSQLGLDVNQIEEHLAAILARAGRWGAVLLIDEADVYIRKRGDDIVQNAIVGVFLRLLEYYRGVLFMTSNRGDVIDDAILSRATAWVKYQMPNDELLTEIWKVLAGQYNVRLTDKDLKKIVAELPGVSGRSVRNILKLATLLKGSKTTVADLINLSSYQSLETKQ